MKVYFIVALIWVSLNACAQIYKAFDDPDGSDWLDGVTGIITLALVAWAAFLLSRLP
jgi:hypothetical protein